MTAMKIKQKNRYNRKTRRVTMAAKVAMMASCEEQGTTRISSQIMRVLMGGFFT
mgnify:CR=1 FL=1